MRNLRHGPRCVTTSILRSILAILAVVTSTVLSPGPLVAQEAVPESEASGIAGLEAHEAFLETLMEESSDQALARMDDRLLELVDGPVLMMLMKAVQENLGEVKEAKIIKSEEWDHEGETMVRTVSEVSFEQGTGTLSLTVGPDGKVLGFDLKSGKITDWLKEPADKSVYQQGSEHFIRLFLDGEVDKTFEMMHASLREAVPRSELEGMIERVRATNGDLEGVKFADDAWEVQDGLPTLLLNFDVECENRVATCEMKIQFVGMQGQITGFHFQ